ncbi:hypothetical protein T459_28074 [Capsicum annuum]|uniref:Uncharacterized protein n=1 Tax=Capsicum annuum TaxID=4072 RepID=A0A2G2YFT0_CAPAN|nr:hypothetical protein T459_28074 [Capsicum annuum]
MRHLAVPYSNANLAFGVMCHHHVGLVKLDNCEFGLLHDMGISWRATEIDDCHFSRLHDAPSAQVLDVSNPVARGLGFDVLPTIVGWLSNGEKQILRTGIFCYLKQAIKQFLLRYYSSLGNI